ncbi:MAG: toast rack family protein [bacterium]
MTAGRSRKDHRLGARRLRSAVGALPVALLVVGAALFVAGCGVSTGPTEELVVNEPLGGAAVTDVEVTMGAGKLTVSPGSIGLVSGLIRYNVAAWKPTVDRSDSSVTIKQGSQKGLSGIGSDIVNEWRLELGRAPMRLKVSAGAYQGSYDLSGLVLQGLTVKDGAAKTQVMFNSPNPGQMDRLQYETGASEVTLTGLANANFKTMEFKGGAGSFTLDFSGQLRTDASVRAKAGVGSLRIVVPAQTAARVTVDGALTDVSVEGSWTTSGKTYSTSVVGGDQQAKILTIAVDMSVGSLKLVAR